MDSGLAISLIEGASLSQVSEPYVGLSTHLFGFGKLHPSSSCPINAVDFQRHFTEETNCLSIPSRQIDVSFEISTRVKFDPNKVF